MRNRNLQPRSKIEAVCILHKYTSWIEQKYILVFTVHLMMAQILSDLLTGIKQKMQKWQKTGAICLLPVGKSVNI